MRVPVFVTLAVFGYGAIALVAQQNVSKKVVVGTMLNEQSNDKIEFQHADCTANQSGDELACDFQVAVVWQVERDTCTVFVMGFHRVLHRRGEATWESEPGSPDEVCGTSDVLTLRGSTNDTFWTMTRRRTAPTRDIDSLFCRKLPREETFTTDARKKLPVCHFLRPARQ